MAQDIFGEGRDSYEVLLDTLGGEEKGQEAPEAISVGERIKKLRKDKNLSLQVLSERTGFSQAMLSQIENHVISPSLGTLIKLAKALEMKMGALISAPGEKAFTIVRKGEGKLLSRFASKAGLSYGYSYQSLCPEMKEWHMEPFLVTLEPASGSKKPSRHEGEEFIYVLDGMVKVTLSDFTDVLCSGDSIYYHSTLPHLVECHEAEPALILAVLYSATG